MENIFFNMFSGANGNHLNILLFRRLKQKNYILKNPRKCSEFQYANYKFVVSFYKETSVTSNKL
jgi:hypothetical protein